ncbi:hypothetical protein [Algoriphagus litoralis]|jgi:hypothetical protein|uniref:hypothetical protein n=1 Tax=Algoriphagus litoralis TaxID=2202829 RepID=UPI0013002542|nr:hypothetical protein [Algoriphagus litoralis]
MKNSKLTMTLWLGGLASGIFAGYYLYQNREKLGPQKEKMLKLLSELQKTSEQIGKKLKDAGIEGIEKGKKTIANATSELN